MYDSEAFDPTEYEDAIRVLAREKIQNECSCGSESTRTEDHRPECVWRQKAEKYHQHAVDRVKAAKLAREKAEREAAEKAASQPPAARVYSQAEVDALLAKSKAA